MQKNFEKFYFCTRLHAQFLECFQGQMLSSWNVFRASGTFLWNFFVAPCSVPGMFSGPPALFCGTFLWLHAQFLESFCLFEESFCLFCGGFAQFLHFLAPKLYWKGVKSSFSNDISKPSSTCMGRAVFVQENRFHEKGSETDGISNRF